MRERREFIRTYLLAHGSAGIAELNGFFPDKSAMTIRRDLAALEEEGILIRTHGGARINPAYTASEPLFDLKEAEDPAGKKIVAKKAAPLAAGIRSVYLDAGTTVAAFARELDKVDEMTVITNGVNIAHELLLKPRPPQLTLLGGTVNGRTLAVSGLPALRQIAEMNIDTAFMSTTGFSARSGFTGSDPAECELKRAVIQKANRVIMLMTHMKRERSMLYTFAEAKDIDVLVTDEEPEEGIREEMAAAGVAVL
ncbi:MAG: DeoR/GlpR transcriptional regulator [Clostridia bacterium]|nr:DeoR/GlpR transcriptional regulator [Clostridia bacterium]